MITDTNVNSSTYHICIAGKGGLPKIDPNWVNHVGQLGDPAMLKPLPFIMGIDIALEHEGGIFDSAGNCLRVFNFNVVPMPGGWVAPHTAAPINERKNVALDFSIEFDAPIHFDEMQLTPIAFVRHGGCFMDALEINGKICKPMLASN